MQLLGSTENKITKDKSGENVPHLKITEVVLVHCDIVNNDYQQDSRGLYMFVPNKLIRHFSNKPYICKSIQLSQNMMKLRYGSQIKIVNH